MFINEFIRIAMHAYVANFTDIVYAKFFFYEVADDGSVDIRLYLCSMQTDRTLEREAKSLL